MAKNYFTAVDIGTNAVKILQLELTQAGIVIVNSGMEKYPRQSAVERISDEVVIEALSQLMRRGLFRTKPVAMSIPRYLVTVKGLSGLPASATVDDIDRMIPIQLGTELPFPISDSIYDSYNLQRSSDGISLEVVAAKKASAQRCVDIAEKIGLKLEVIVPSAFATYAVVFDKHKDQLAGRTIAVADIGAGITDICIIQHGRLAFSRSFALGGNNLTQAFEQEYELSFQEAEERKQKANLETSDRNALTRRWAENLSTQILQSFRAFTGEDRVDNINSLWLCGGSSQVTGLGEYLSDKLGMEVNIWNPLQGIGGKPVEETMQNGMSVALGIGVIALEGKKRAPTVNANLLPREIKERAEKVRQKVTIFTVAFIALLILVGASLVFIAWRHSQQVSYRKITDQIKTLEQKEETLKVRAALENSILMQQVMIPYVTPLEVLREISDKLPDRGKIALTSLNIDRKGKVTMSVEASSHADISEMIQVLSKIKLLDRANLFTEVKHGSISRTTKDNRPIFQVQIACALNEKAMQEVQ